MVDLFKLKTDELKALVHYKEVLEEEIDSPRASGRKKLTKKGIKTICRILTRYCFENLCRLEVDDLPKYKWKQLKPFS